MFTHTCLCCTLILVKGQWCPVAGKVTVGLASHWPCVQWRNYNFCAPWQTFTTQPNNIITIIINNIVLIHNSGHFGPPLPCWAPRHCQGCRWLVTPLHVSQTFVVYPFVHLWPEGILPSVLYDTRCNFRCAQKSTWVSSIYRMEPTTIKWKTDMLKSISKQ